MADNFDLNDVSKIKGLSEAEAAEKLARDGYNEIPSAKKRSFWAIAWGVIREPMLLLLIGGGIIYMILGDIQEALMLLGFVFVIIGITLLPGAPHRKNTGSFTRPFQSAGFGYPRWCY